MKKLSSYVFYKLNLECQFLLILPTVVETEVPVATIECRQVYEKCMGTRVVDVLKEGFKAKVIQENPDIVKNHGPGS